MRMCCTYRKFENHLTNWAVLFLLNLMSGKYILSTAELGYRTQKNISFALRRCIGVNVDEFTEVKESICCFLINCLIFLGLSFLSLFLRWFFFCFYFCIFHAHAQLKFVHEIILSKSESETHRHKKQSAQYMVSKKNKIFILTNLNCANI